MAVRDQTADHNNVYSCMTEDEYHLRELDVEGVALDIGAHIGGVSIGLALDNPNARVIAVEALSENVALLTENAERNNVSDRVTVIHAAASRPGKRRMTILWNYGGSESATHHRYIGGARGAQSIPFADASAEKVPAISLDSLVDAYGEIDFAKVDCEGCEYDFLATPAVASVREFRGEHHAGFDEITRLLGETHLVSLTGGSESFGAFAAVLR